MNNWDRRIESYFKDLNVDFSSNEEIPIQKAIGFVADAYMKKWKTSYDYTKASPKQCKGVKIPNDSYDITMLSNLTYIRTLFDFIIHGNTYGIQEWALKECEEWEIMGGNCIYFSTLLYYMIFEDRKRCSRGIKYHQGFYRHNTRADYPSFYPWSGQHNGLHAWLTIDGAILDIAIQQQEPFFDFGNSSGVIGEAPEGLLYMGFEESPETTMYYLKKILKFSDMPYELWMAKHKLNSINLTKTFLNEELIALEKDIDEDYKKLKKILGGK